MNNTASLFVLISLLVGCSATPGPDKSLTGAVLGAGWGAGAGAVIGNQMNDSGTGAAIGSAFGAGSGLLTGIGLDVAEGTALQQERELEALRVQTVSNERELLAIQETFDKSASEPKPALRGGQVFFDENRASLRLGAVKQLERIAQYIKSNTAVREVEIHGHSDDLGNQDTNMKLSDARARSVQGYLASQGVPTDMIRIVAHGAAEPLVANSGEAGRQLNRRAEVVVIR